MKIFEQPIYLLILFFISSYSYACINGPEKVLSTGTTLYIDHDGHVPYGHNFWIDEPKAEIRKLDSLYQIKPSLEYLNEKGIVFIVSKEYQKAIDLYLDIEKKNPNQYSTASNLGTAYELIGDNKNALKWIARALELNPDSHQKSEWIHANILKIKLGQLQFLPKQLIGVDFGEDQFPKTNLTKTDLEKLSNQIYFQLNERMSFVKPKDDILAQLLFEYGNVLLLNDKKDEAKEVYEMAFEYGFQTPLIHERIELTKVKEKSINTLFSNNTKTKSSFLSEYWILISSISVLFIILIIYIVKLKRK